MQLAVYGLGDVALRVRGILEPAYSVELYPDRAALALGLRTHPIDALLVDPAMHPWDPGVWPLIARYQSLPLIIYSGLDRTTVLAVLEAHRIGSPLLVVRNIEDSPSRLNHFLRSASPVASINDTILDRLTPSLDGLPSGLASTIAFLFAEAEPGRTVQWMTTTCGLARRSLERWIVRAGLRSARLLTIAPSVTRAYCYLGDRGYTVCDVAAKVGVSSRRTLLAEIRACVGTDSVSALRGLTPHAFVTAIMKVLRPFPEPAAGR